MGKIVIILSIFALIAVSCGQATSKQTTNNTVAEDSTTSQIVDIKLPEDFQTILQQLELNKDKYLKFLHQLELNTGENYSEFMSQQDLSYSPDKSIWLIPQMIDVDNVTSSFLLSCTILIIDNKTKKIVSISDKPYQLESSAWQLKKIWIGEGSYLLSDSVRAFCINANYEGSSRVSPASGTETFLFVQQGNSLKKIFTYKERSEGGSFEDSNCESYFSETSTDLTISDKKTNGFYDIIIKTERVNRENIRIGEGENDCEEKTTNETDSQHFRFNGKEYEEDKKE